jgi:rhodanese-related sulfurtransferase
MKKTAEQLVAEAMAQVHTLTVADARHLHADPAVQFVDLRDVRELEREGFVPGAFHAPRGMLEFWVDPTCQYHHKTFADADKHYVLFCAMGWRSALSARTMQEMGFGKVSHIEGGFTAWKADGAPVAEKAPRKAS